MDVLVAPDSFRGTLPAREFARVVARVGRERGWRVVEVPLSDGGEGFLDVFGPANRATDCSDPLGRTVKAPWLYRNREAVIESARVIGLELVGGPEGNDPLSATSRGLGELLAAVLDCGVDRVVVGLGGTATTDGGLAAVEALGVRGRAALRGVELVVACDVTTRFVDAARLFAPQKGASPAVTSLLERRLERIAGIYEQEFGIDVTALEGSGAAGGLAGGLAALGGSLVRGFDLVAEEVDLPERIRKAEMVVTGEGFLDATSLQGKVVGEVAKLASDAGVFVLVVVGDADPEVAAELASRPDTKVVSLAARFGRRRACSDAPACVEEVFRGLA